MSKCLSNVLRGRNQCLRRLPKLLQCWMLKKLKKETLQSLFHPKFLISSSRSTESKICFSPNNSTVPKCHHCLRACKASRAGVQRAGLNKGPDRQFNWILWLLCRRLANQKPCSRKLEAKLNSQTRLNQKLVSIGHSDEQGRLELHTML